MVTLKNEAGLVKECKLGFSWTTFFFGFIVPLIRGDIKWALILCILSVVIGVPTMGIGASIVGIVFSFKYNKLYVKELLQKGFKPATEADHQQLASAGIVASNMA